MSTYLGQTPQDPAVLAQQTHDWLESLEDVLHAQGPDFVKQLLRNLQIHAQKKGVVLPVTSQTPYMNTIPAHRQPPYPGDLKIERRIKSIIRWNAMAMVVRANRDPAAPGGHISSYASLATLYEVGYNHFFRGKDHACGGDAIYFQGHSAPGNYSRAFVEGRLNESHLENFRRELRAGIGGGLSSYPHPWLMPDFWEYPTVSMGLGPIMSIYRARFMRYLDDRGIRDYKGAKVWAFVGDGESDEPETLGAISLAAREKIDNLIWVVNCNLQRLDGPVRGNSKIIQELEATFRGAGWNVIKVLWGSDWDPLFEADHDALLANRLEEMVDGQYQKLRVEGGKYIREKVFGVNEQLAKMVEHLSDNELWHLRLGGHDPRKVYTAFKSASEHEGAPTVILAKTIKGYGTGEAGEGKNITHQQKKLNEKEMLAFRDRFDIPLTDEQVGKVPFYKPADDSIEMQYIRERLNAQGGHVPTRRVTTCNWEKPDDSAFTQFDEGTGDRDIATTMAFVRILQKLLRDKSLGKYIVPIIPDEARTFGMDGLFPMVGIYSHVGQLYEPVDRDSIAYYKEATDGQILEEGINEAGAMCDLIAAGTSHAAHQQPMIPFYVYYSMFGFQRIGDLVWCAGDMRTRGFMVGGTAGRTTLNGEGLQHEDGQSHLLFSIVPNIRCYDPSFAYEIGVIVRDGIKRMYYENEDIFYYMSVGNESYTHPAKPEGCDEGILKGAYKVKSAPGGGSTKGKHRATLLGSGSIMNCVLDAQKILAEKYDVEADVWSVTSYTELRREALECEQYNMLHPNDEQRVPYVTECFDGPNGPVVASSDYMKALPDSVSKWVPGGIYSLGTDGFGRSESREALRDHFEVDARYVTLATLTALAREGKIDKSIPAQAIADLGINPDKPNPLYA
ncbi:pyruvate dehydrogenase (acetyl-transferring), homodimeric type [Planctomycetales bacterium ZRK34]|nr:pyruvate dehydrogenase (acetyl-transferring), homodimeric type [Planctomycetales bacterium ZRK34]